MKRIKEWFDGQKLNTKFTLISLCFVLIPMVALGGWLFRSMEDNVIQERMDAMGYRLSEAYERAAGNVETINMSTQFFLSDHALSDLLNAVKDGEEYTTQELLDFYNQDVASLERMVNNNSALYQTRVYVDSDSLQEMMPILYRSSRMKNLAWAGQEDFFGWQFGYLDSLFEHAGRLNEGRALLSLVTPMETYDGEPLAVLEVAMYMDVMFPMVYEEAKEQWACFVTEDGQYYFSQENDTEKNRLLAEKLLNGRQAEEGQQVSYLGGRQKLVAGYQPIKELGGALLSVEDISGNIGQVYRQRAVYIVAGFALVLLFGYMINRTVNAVLGRLYRILTAIRKVQEGDLEVVIPEGGSDEMGELGKQINAMLVSIKRLTDDNLKRELLVKNTQVRALQNQINAHFIYNVLESVKMMAEIDEKYDISDAITALGKLLRYSMHWTSGNVTVEEEMEYIRNYLKLINLRFDYEIYLSENIPWEIRRQEIPKMSLQPIVENAIYHGIEQIAEDTSIYVKGIRDGEDCIIEITDAGRGMSGEEVENLYRKINGEIETSGGSGNGIGLKNVQDRIKMNFGEKYGIEIASRLGLYTKIMVRIPMRTMTEGGQTDEHLVDRGR